jgi:hypothetical protein
MKKVLLRTVAIVVALLAALVFLGSQTDEFLYRQMISKGPGAISALGRVLDKSDAVSAAILYTASSVAFGENRLEDAGFLFYIARFRVRFDKAMFPPTGTGGNSPMLAFAALQQQLGSVLNPTLMAEPKVFARVLERVKPWTPKLTGLYKPGWDFAAKGNESSARAEFEDGKKEFLKGLGGICELLQDPAYFAAFRVVQDYSLKFDSSRPKKESCDAALETMGKIEKAKGIEGVSSLNKQ